MNPIKKEAPNPASAHLPADSALLGESFFIVSQTISPTRGIKKEMMFRPVLGWSLSFLLISVSACLYPADYGSYALIINYPIQLTIFISNKTMAIFEKKDHPKASYTIGTDGIPFEMFFKMDSLSLFE